LAVPTDSRACAGPSMPAVARVNLKTLSRLVLGGLLRGHAFALQQSRKGLLCIALVCPTAATFRSRVVHFIARNAPVAPRARDAPPLLCAHSLLCMQEYLDKLFENSPTQRSPLAYSSNYIIAVPPFGVRRRQRPRNGEREHSANDQNERRTPTFSPRL
jgi:hypothetical protein